MLLEMCVVHVFRVAGEARKSKATVALSAGRDSGRKRGVIAATVPLDWAAWCQIIGGAESLSS